MSLTRLAPVVELDEQPPVAVAVSVAVSGPRRVADAPASFAALPHARTPLPAPAPDADADADAESPASGSSSGSSASLAPSFASSTGSALASLAALPKPHPVRRNEHLAVLLPKRLWKPDSSASKCEIFDCQTRFSLLERRHHCRKCGGIFCAACSTHTAALLDTSNLPWFHPPVAGSPSADPKGKRPADANAETDAAPSVPPSPTPSFSLSRAASLLAATTRPAQSLAPPTPTSPSTSTPGTPTPRRPLSIHAFASPLSPVRDHRVCEYCHRQFLPASDPAETLRRAREKEKWDAWGRRERARGRAAVGEAAWKMWDRVGGCEDRDRERRRGGDGDNDDDDDDDEEPPRECRPILRRTRSALDGAAGASASTSTTDSTSPTATRPRAPHRSSLPPLPPLAYAPAFVVPPSPSASTSGSTSLSRSNSTSGSGAGPARVAPAIGTPLSPAVPPLVDGAQSAALGMGMGMGMGGAGGIQFGAPLQRFPPAPHRMTLPTNPRILAQHLDARLAALASSAHPDSRAPHHAHAHEDDDADDSSEDADKYLDGYAHANGHGHGHGRVRQLVPPQFVPGLPAQRWRMASERALRVAEMEAAAVRAALQAQAQAQAQTHAQTQGQQEQEQLQMPHHAPMHPHPHAQHPHPHPAHAQQHPHEAQVRAMRAVYAREMAARAAAAGTGTGTGTGTGAGTATAAA